MSVPTCNHIRKNGRLCQSPALHGRDFCYFHLTNRARRQKTARALRRGGAVPLNLPFPEDIYSIQVCLHEIMVGIAEKRIDPSDSGRLLYSLQLAATNVIAAGATQDGLAYLADDEYAEGLPLEAYPSLEEDFDLPKGHDLTVDPDDNFFLEDEDERGDAPPRKPVAPALLAQKAGEPAA
jgi:hypothetical protein